MQNGSALVHSHTVVSGELGYESSLTPEGNRKKKERKAKTSKRVEKILEVDL